MDEVTEPTADTKRQFLRHTIATLAYRNGLTLVGAPDGFDRLCIAETVRTPVEILAHINDLLDWTLRMSKNGQSEWQPATPLTWEKEVARFYAALEELDTYFASDDPIAVPIEKLFQGPIADALTHVGQLAILRRVAGSPIPRGGYFKTDLVAGRFRPEQSATV